MGISARWGNRLGPIWALWALALWLFGTPIAWAQIRPAAHRIVSKRLQRVVEMIPGSATDLPPYLVKPSDVYLLITAGATYTDVQVLANPEVPPQTVARALSSALGGTPLAGRTVEWSADRYSAAQVSTRHPRVGSIRGVNLVPVGPLLAGLRRAGLTPHLLLRIPAHARTGSLPFPHYGTRAFRWYDARQVGSQSGITVTARMTWISLARMLAYYLLLPLVCVSGLWLAGFLSGRGRLGDAARRQLFRSVSRGAVVGGFLAQFGGMLYLQTQTPTPAAIADLWFGSGTTTVLVPFLVAGALPLPLFLLLAYRQELRRFGPVSDAPTIPMSDEEKAVRKRVAQYSMIPHLVGGSLLLAALFAVPRTSPLYSFVHPVAQFLPFVGGGLVTWLFKKRLDKFTQKTLHEDLTWRARQLGQMLGVRMPDVFVEDSSRAAHLAFATHQGHHITLSRKLAVTFTSAETDFVLAYHLVCMKRKPSFGKAGLTLLLLFLPVFAFPILLLWGSVGPGGLGPVLLHSFWFVPAAISYLLVSTALTPLVIKSSMGRQINNDTEADREALEATGNLVAAESALDKLSADAALSPEAQAIRQFEAQLDDGLTDKSEKNAVQLQSGRLLLRRAALQKTAQTLRFAPEPGTRKAVPEASPFSAPKLPLD